MGRIILIVLFFYALSSQSQGNNEDIRITNVNIPDVAIFGIVKTPNQDTLYDYQVFVVNEKDTLYLNFKGKFEMNLALGEKYVFGFKKEGYQKKYFSIDLIGIPKEDAVYGFDFPMNVTLKKGDADIPQKKKVFIFFDKKAGYLEFRIE